MSFCQEVKKEIISYKWEEDELKILLNSYLQFNSQIIDDDLVIKVPQKYMVDFFEKNYREIFYFKTHIQSSKKISKIIVKNFDKSIYEELFNFRLEYDKDIYSYLAGVFLAKGQISDPHSKKSLFEIRVKDFNNLSTLGELLNKKNISSRVNERNNYYFLLVRKWHDISELLKMIKSFKGSMIFDDVWIERDYNDKQNKYNNLIKINYEKSNETSRNQIKKFKKILTDKKITLSIEQKQIIDLRIKNPNLSYIELAEIYNMNNDTYISKSTIARKLRELENL